MQVFLPFPDIKKSLDCLDKRRLGKQRVEVRMVMGFNTINTSKGIKYSHWLYHPVVEMFRYNGNFIIEYYNRTLEEFHKRGCNNIKLTPFDFPFTLISYPKWWGDDRLHLSHRSNLLRKALDDANGIGARGKPKKKSTELLDRLSMNDIMVGNTPINLPYFWPKP
jgi:hypothetical protein